jgi:hypothetical protein
MLYTVDWKAQSLVEFVNDSLYVGTYLPSYLGE